MSTLELKQQIIQSLQAANDIEAMQHVQALMDELKMELYRDTIKPLSIEEYEARIKVGIGQIEKGEGTSFEDFEKEMGTW